MNIPDDTINILLARYFANEASPREEAQVYAWIAADEDNLRAFEAYMQIWDYSRKMPQVVVNEDVAWTKFNNYTIHQAGTPAPKIRPTWQWGKIAAAAMIILAGAWLTVTLQATKSNVAITLPAVAAVQTDTLPDHSVVTLNKHTELTYNDVAGKNQRTVTLKGEAFFEVAPDQTKPFVIEAGPARIRVTGTSFNVKTHPGFTEVIVHSGTVQVSRNGETIELNAGENTKVGIGNELQKAQQKDALYNYYISKNFICDDTPLWKLVEKLNEAYQSNIVIPNKQLSGLPLTVTFSNERLDTILNILRETLMVDIVQQGDSIIIK